ncbi:MAG: hypothetical protein WD898_02375 [Candidatus Paceibacterota bacterium]
MNSMVIPKYTCKCGYTMDRTVHPSGGAPVEGEVSLCSRCAAISVFNRDLTQRPATEKEMKEIEKSSGWFNISRDVKKILSSYH